MWNKRWPHEWRHTDGFVIQRMWTSTKGKRDFFLCYKNLDDYQSGDNFASTSSLKKAKEMF